MNYGRTPFQHQIDAKNFALKNGGACFWMEMRTGKTFSTVMALAESGKFPALIVCPKSIMPVWRHELVLNGADPESISELTGPEGVRRRDLAKENPICIANYEMLEPYDLFRIREWGAIVLDESIKIANLSAKRTQYCLKYVQDKEWPVGQMRFCLSGAPASESPFQLIAQKFFVHAQFLGYKDYSR